MNRSQVIDRLLNIIFWLIIAAAFIVGYHFFKGSGSGNHFWVVCFLLCLGAAVHSAHENRVVTSLVLCGFVGFSMLVILGAFQGFSSWVFILPCIIGSIVFAATRFDGRAQMMLLITALPFTIAEAVLVWTALGTFSGISWRSMWSGLAPNEKYLVISFLFFALAVVWKAISTRIYSVSDTEQRLIVLRNGSNWLLLASLIFFLAGVAVWIPGLSQELHKVPLLGGIIDWIDEMATIIKSTWNGWSPVTRQIISFLAMAVALLGICGAFITRGLMRIAIIALVIMALVGSILGIRYLAREQSSRVTITTTTTLPAVSPPPTQRYHSGPPPGYCPPPAPGPFYGQPAPPPHFSHPPVPPFGRQYSQPSPPPYQEKRRVPSIVTPSEPRNVREIPARYSAGYSPEKSSGSHPNLPRMKSPRDEKNYNGLGRQLNDH